MMDSTLCTPKIGWMSALGLIVIGILAMTRLITAQPAGPKEIMVRGYIAVGVGGRQDIPGVPATLPAQDVFLPGVKVFLHEASSGTVSDPVTTDLSGRFTVRKLKPGRYQVCWEAWERVKGCSGPHSLVRWFTNISTIRIPIEREVDTTILYGKVTMKDGSSPRHLQPFANINAFARVSVRDKDGNTLQTVDVNNFNDYLVPYVSIRKELVLRTSIEKSEHDQPLMLDSAQPVQPVSVSIDNNPPRLEPLVAVDSIGKRVKVARPSDTVTVRARASDPDGDTVMYRWVLSGDSGVLSSTSDPTVKWGLPSTPGTHAVTLYAFDGKGGYAESRLPLTTSRQGIMFAGIVDGTDASVVVGAEVEVNGRITATDSNGFFQLRVADAPRFVLNIRKPGYGLVSRIYDGGIPGGRWTLTRGSRFRFEPERLLKEDIDVQNERSGRECPGPASHQLNWKDFPKLTEPVFQDGKGNIIPKPKEIEQLPGLPTNEQDLRRCGPGIRVLIKANSLVDSQGNSPTDPVDLTLATVDVSSPGQMPGDYTVLLPDGDPRVMDTFGAATVDITAGTKRYNLRPGTTAEVLLPVDRIQVQAGTTPPPTIPLLYYNERQGVWVREGEATLEGSGASAAYRATVKHFSPINMDTLKVNQACVRMLSPTAPPNSMPAQYRLEITLEQAGSAPILRTEEIDDNAAVQEHVLYNLPTDTNMVIFPIRKNDPDPNKNNIPMGVFVVNTGAKQNPTTPNRPLGPPYNACSTQVTLTDFGIQFYPDLPNDGAFLHGLYSFAATNLTETDPNVPSDLGEATPTALEEATDNYYAQIDPRQLKTTLACFKVANGFPLKAGDSCALPTGFTPPPTGTEVKAAYANTADLGFGREMHCTQSGADVACYVTNYGAYTPPGTGGDVAKAQEAADALNGVPGPLPGATVAMEYSRIEDAGVSGPITYSDPDRVVKFYLYIAGERKNRVDLDLKGERPIPQLCMVCHGGEYPGGPTTGAPPFTSRNEVKLNAKFLPFDLRSFSYASAPLDKLNQQDEFKALNQMVAVAPPSDPLDPTNTVIQDLISDWYSGGALLQDENLVVTGWGANPLQQGTYRNMVARACRTCHVTNGDSVLRFNTASDFNSRLGSVQVRVCKDHVMPHARRTHDLFWTSVGPNQAAQLQAYGDTVHASGWQKVGDPGYDPTTICANSFTSGGATPPGSFYATTIQGIWNTNCTGCHNAASAPSFANLSLEGVPSAITSHAQIVNVNATELSSLKRIAPGALANSYLFQKIQGTHGSLAGCPNIAACFGAAQACGGKMPCSGGPLDVVETTNIETWINGGANP